MNVIALYKLEQVPLLKEFLRTHSPDLFTVVALRADIEESLDLAGISFDCGRKLRTVEPIERLRLAESIVDEIVTSKDLFFWQYEGISFAKLHRITLQDYLSKLFYWMDIFSQLIVKYPDGSLYIWSDGMHGNVKNLFDNFSLIQETAAQIVVQCNDISLHVLPGVTHKKYFLSQLNFFLERMIFSTLLFFVNSFVTLKVKKKSKRLLIADYWRNTASYANYLEDTELIFLERMEFFKLTWKNILQYRIRFFSVFGRRTNNFSTDINGKAEVIKKEWQILSDKKPLFLNKEFIGVPLNTVSQHLMTLAVAQIEQDCKNVNSVEQLLIRVKPDAIVVRASASQQVHFSLLCQLAKKLSIPSIEPQHGLFYLGPGSVPKHSTAQYLATYGPLASEELKVAGYAGTTVDIGSPRFDVYATLPEIPISEALTVLIVLPDDTTGTWFDSYDVVDLLDTVAALAQSDISLNILLKARSGAESAEFGYAAALKRLHSFTNVTIERETPLHHLMGKSHVVVSVFSTILVEAIAAERAVIYWAQNGFHSSVVSLHIDSYSSKNGCFVCYQKMALIDTIKFLTESKNRFVAIEQVKKFGRENFSFSKGSAERYKNLLDTFVVYEKNT